MDRREQELAVEANKLSKILRNATRYLPMYTLLVTFDTFRGAGRKILRPGRHTKCVPFTIQVLSGEETVPICGDVFDGTRREHVVAMPQVDSSLSIKLFDNDTGKSMPLIIPSRF